MVDAEFFLTEEEMLDGAGAGVGSCNGTEQDDDDDEERGGEDKVGGQVDNVIEVSAIVLPH